MSKNLAAELRRAERIAAEFWVMVQGVDTKLVARHGNISTTGILFTSDDLHIEMGSLEFLHLTTIDRQAGVVVMAQAVRLLDLDAKAGLPQQAIAFEFMPENADRRAELEGLLEHIRVSQRQDSGPKGAQVFALEVPNLTLETTWPVQVGDIVQVAIRGPYGGTRIPFEGQAKSVLVAPGSTAARPLFQVQTTPMQAGVRSHSAEHASITQSIDLAMAAIMSNSATADLVLQRPHLKGSLNRICLASLLSWFDMSRMSGLLQVSREDSEYTLFIREGAIVDVKGNDEGLPKDTLRVVLGWTHGDFEFRDGPVTREDRIGIPMLALLLDLARQADESEGQLGFVA
jgi:hypothetical protein